MKILVDKKHIKNNSVFWGQNFSVEDLDSSRAVFLLYSRWAVPSSGGKKACVVCHGPGSLALERPMLSQVGVIWKRTK